MGTKLETLKHVRNISEEKQVVIHGEQVRASRELSLKRKQMGKAQAMFFNALFEAKGDKKKIWLSWEKMQVFSIRKWVWKATKN